MLNNVYITKYINYSKTNVYIFWKIKMCMTLIVIFDSIVTIDSGIYSKLSTRLVPILFDTLLIIVRAAS